MRHMMRENIGLISTRFVFRKQYGFHHAFVTKNILDINQIQSPGTAQLFPLYLYADTSKTDLFSHLEACGDRKPNLNPKIVTALKSAYGKQPSPDDMFHYIYAVLYADTYREKYAEFLKSDFPRVPFTTEFTLFQALATLGKHLVDLHLLRSEELDPPVARFQGNGETTASLVPKARVLSMNQKKNASTSTKPSTLSLFRWSCGSTRSAATKC